MTVEQFTDWLSDGSLTLPPVPSKAHPEGHSYVVPSPSIETGLKLQALAVIMAKAQNKADVTEADIAKLKLSDDEERDLGREILGDIHDQMIEDGVAWAHFKALTSYAIIGFAFSEDQAEDAVRKGLFGGKAPAANRAAKRAESRGKAPKGRTVSTGSSR